MYRGRLAEDYDGIGQYVLVALAGSSVAAAYKARVAAGDFGGNRVIPRGSLVHVAVHRGNVEVFLGNRPQVEYEVVNQHTFKNQVSFLSYQHKVERFTDAPQTDEIFVGTTSGGGRVEGGNNLPIRAHDALWDTQWGHIIPVGQEIDHVRLRTRIMATAVGWPAGVLTFWALRYQNELIRTGVLAPRDPAIAFEDLVGGYKEDIDIILPVSGMDNFQLNWSLYNQEFINAYDVSPSAFTISRRYDQCENGFSYDDRIDFYRTEATGALPHPNGDFYLLDWLKLVP